MESPIVTPGDYIRNELEARGWLQRDLAFVLGLPEQAVNAVVLGKRGITADLARLLSVAFDKPAEFFLTLQNAKDLSQAKTPDARVVRMVQLQSAYPLREMIKRGWIDDAPNALETELAKFFGVSTADDLPHMSYSAKKTTYGSTPPLQLAWLFRVKQIAAEMVLPTYSDKKLRDALPKLHALMSAPEEARHVPRILSECGIRFVVVESLPAAKIDGVCFWLDNGKSPVVGMSLRFDRIDNFWFVLMHELEHVFNKDGKTDAMIDDLEGEKAGIGDGIPEQERLANAAAAAFCVPPKEMDSWVARKHPYYSEADLLGFARRIQVHPGIVAGQLRSRTNNYKIFTKYLAKICSIVTATAVVDGFGQIAPVS